MFYPEEKGGNNCGDYPGTLFKYAEYVCAFHERTYVQYVCVTTAACVLTTVGETSCRALQHSRRQSTLLTLLHICEYISVNVCVHAHVCADRIYCSSVHTVISL